MTPPKKKKNLPSLSKIQWSAFIKFALVPFRDGNVQSLIKGVNNYFSVVIEKV